ncbi:MAG: inositol monophosphatase family protein [Planctomycetota bacterium]
MDEAIDRWMAELVQPVRALAADLQHMHARLSVGRSKGGVDVVTAADHHSEEQLVALLRERFPTHGIVAEEGTARSGTDWCWYLDPLDGTANYQRGLPDWAISLGLAHEGRPVAGVIAAPAWGRCWSGAIGHGVWCDGRRLEPPPPAGPMHSWLVGSDHPWDPDQRSRNLRVVQAYATRVRMPLARGSAAVALAQLCAGRLDAYLLAAAKDWDYCAGVALLTELGLQAEDWTGRPWRIGTASLLAASGPVAAELRPLVQAADPTDA